MKTLIICDVQKEFMFCISKEYYESLQTYVLENDFNEIIVIVDENMGDIHIPLWLYELSPTVIVKSYGGPAQSEMEEFVEQGEMKVEKEDESWVDEYGNLFISTIGTHETFLVPEDMINKFKELNSQSEKVELVGGATDECLQDVEDALTYFDVDCDTNDDYTYGGYYRNPDVDWYEFELEWVQVNLY